MFETGDVFPVDVGLLGEDGAGEGAAEFLGVGVLFVVVVAVGAPSVYISL